MSSSLTWEQTKVLEFQKRRHCLDTCISISYSGQFFVLALQCKFIKLISLPQKSIFNPQKIPEINPSDIPENIDPHNFPSYLDSQHQQIRSDATYLMQVRKLHSFIKI